VDLELGLRQGIRVLVDQPLGGPQSPFVGAWAGFGRTETRRPTNGVVAEVEVVDRGLGLFAGVRSAAWGELRAGFERIEFDVDGAPDLPEERGELAAIARWEVDALDQVPFASSGVLAVVELRSARPGLGADERFDRLDARGAWAVSRGRHALRLAASWVTGFGEPLPFTRQAMPGGFLELTALEPGALRGSTAATVSLVHAFRPGGPASGREGRLRIGASVEAGRAWDAADAVQPLKLRPGASLWIGAETPLGPAGLAWGWLRGERPGWVARVGFGL
jgi:NTE family protein